MDKESAILITGASSGLGAEYARQLALKDDRKIILTARREARLSDLAAELGEKVDHITADLSVESERVGLIEQLRSKNLRIEMLVNNAGFGSLGPFENSEYRLQAKMIEVNCIAPIHLFHCLSQDLKESNRGVVVNVCSTVSFQAMPYMATYGATKSFLLSHTLALRAEAEGKIEFFAHCPGPTKTEFHLIVGLDEKLDFLPAASAQLVVEQSLARIEKRGYPVLVNGCTNAFLSQLNRVLPRAWAAGIVAKILYSYRDRRP